MPAPPQRGVDSQAVLREADTAREQGDIPKAVRGYAIVAEASPLNTYARYWLATCYEQMGELELALQQCNLGLAVDPTQIGLLLRKAAIAVAASDHYLALNCYLKAAECDPDIPDIDALIADRYCFLGEAELGVECFDRALRKDPESTRLQSNRLFVHNYASILPQDALFALHKQWGDERDKEVSTERRPHPNSRIPGRQLRIGYVSGDLRHHAVAFFFEPLLRHHDRSSFAVYCYDASTHAEDDTTTRLKSYGAHWRRAAALADPELADAVRSDEIDILVDLSGHTVMNRLLTFARKPAPIQATWLGYLGTTGLSTVDYRITDGYLDPVGTTERFHTEQLIRLPNAACFSPLPDAPPSGDLPALTSGFVSFGSVNQWSKVNAAVRETWAAILRKVPNSRLVIVAAGAQNPDYTAKIAHEFSRHGITRDRVVVKPTTSLKDFLDLFRELDLTLDPFPYGGGTTTMHSLWMGVPVISLAGVGAFGRNSVGPLTELGLERCIANSTDEYVRIAVEMAAQRSSLRTLRRDLRPRMTRSALLDQPLFTRNMEVAYRRMWERYCASFRVNEGH